MLIHSIWLGLLAWSLVHVLNAFTQHANSRKYIRLGTLALFLVALVAMIPRPAMLKEPEVINLVIYSNQLMPATDHWLNVLAVWVNANSGIISMVWLAGMCLAIIRFGQSHKAMKRYQSGSVNCTDNRLLEITSAMKTKLGIKKSVEIKISSLINSPMTTGFLKPIVYLPLGLSNGLLEDELDAILQHELAHIKHHDFLINYLLVVLETIFFFNPMIILMIRETRQEMEYACDDLVTGYESPLTYSRALLKLQELSLTRSVALAANQNNSELKKRINRMINSKSTNRNPGTAIIAMVLAMSIISTAFIGKEEPVEPPTTTVTEEATPHQDPKTKADTLRFTDMEALKAKIKDLNFENAQNHVFLLNGKVVRLVSEVNGSIKKGEEMMDEIQKELIADGLLREDRPKMTLMFQYSDLLNGKANLGDHYEKYKSIFNRYFPKYDSYATTRVFRYSAD